MKQDHLDNIRSSFTVQAKNFESGCLNFSKKEYLEHTVRCMELRPGDVVLEAAAGTCACGRSAAPFVRSVVCLDATPAMLAVGETEAANSGLANMRFVNGLVEEMPFPDQTFDVVMTRLAFHHFIGAEKPFGEMTRVLKPEGKLVVIDMEAAAEALRETEDRIETMRDPSHVKNLSKQEFMRLFARHGYAVTRQESTAIAVSLEAWLALTDTPGDVRDEITALMQEDMRGKSPTGFAPYLKDGEIRFDQRWLLMIGQRQAPGE